MKPKHAIILSLLLSALIANIYFIIHLPNQQLETAIIARVIDGDTFKTINGETIRLLNINAPEKDTPQSILATAFLKEYENKSLELQITGREKYGRLLARIYSQDKKYLNLELVKKGYASKFLVSQDELKAFDSAEESAIQQGKGIWEPSPFQGCFFVTIEPKKEYLILKNSCQPMSIEGWMLKDESRKQYKFKGTLNDTLLLYSGQGNDTQNKMFWNAGNVWNDDRDSMYLFDSSGKLVLAKSYGY